MNTVLKGWLCWYVLEKKLYGARTNSDHFSLFLTFSIMNMCSFCINNRNLSFKTLKNERIYINDKQHHILSLVYSSRCVFMDNELYIILLRATIEKYVILDGLKKKICVISQFWRLKVPNSGTSRAMLPLRLWAESFLTSSQLLVIGSSRGHSLIAAASIQSTLPSSHGYIHITFSVCVCSNFPFIRMAVIGRQPTLIPSS